MIAKPLTLSDDESILIARYREVKRHGHGSIEVEVRDGRGQMMMATNRIKL